MHYTKREIAERLRSLAYPTTTADTKLTLQEAMDVVSEARDKYIKNSILQLKSETRIVFGNWLSEFQEIDVEYDTTSKKYFTQLPTGVIGLPNDLGVYHLYFDHCEEDLFIPVTPAFRSMYRYSQAISLEGEMGYYLIEDRVYYVQDMPKDRKISMRLISQSKDLGEYDYFPIDGSCIEDVLTIALQLVGVQKQTPEDLTNDNISN
jgi:hypothetical protein